MAFEDTYVALVKTIRTLAYPKYSATTVDSSRYIYSPTSAAAGLPIFVMRPFRGQLEQSTHAVVERLRREGDRSIFWLDTSGWLKTEVDFDGEAEEQDFFLDGNRTNRDILSQLMISCRGQRNETMASDRKRQSTRRDSPSSACLQISRSRRRKLRVPPSRSI